MGSMDDMSDTNAWKHVPPSMRKVWMLRQVCQSAITLIGIAVVLFISGWYKADRPQWVLPIVVLLVVYTVGDLLTQPLQTKWEYDFHTYCLNENELILKKGWLWRSTTVIPLNRVQNIDSEQGPILRFFGLTQVTVHTAVDKHTIDALYTADAQEIMQRISQRVQQVRAMDGE